MKPQDSALETAPNVALLVPSRGHWADAAGHLLTSLGLPQVAVIEAGVALPASVHSVVLIGPPNWTPALPDVEVWQLEVGRAHSSTMASESFLTPCGRAVTLPSQRTLMAVADGRNSGRSAGAGLQQVLFWLRERLIKGSAHLSERDYREWLLTLRILDLRPERKDRLLESMQAQIELRKPHNADPPPSNRRWHNAIVSWFKGAPRSTSSALDLKRVLQRPENLVAAALEHTASQAGRLIGLVRETLANCSTGHQLVAAGVAAALLGDSESVAAVRDRLGHQDWSMPAVAFPRSQVERNGFCYSPLVAAWWFLEACQDDPSFELPEGAGAPRTIAMPITWACLSSGSLVDPDTHSISRSLLDNWLALHSAPLPAGTQIRLGAWAYDPWIFALEQIWLDTLRTIQNCQGKALLRLRPWPAGCRTALSLRYDVDRPVSAAAIEHILNIQSRYAGGPCTSWYYFSDDPNRERQAAQLARHGQEIGVHAQTAEDAMRGCGVTHHSAPTSEYWRGDTTNTVLNTRGAHHCEFLAGQTLTPRPAWIVDDEGIQAIGKVWTTPIHFPLEGSTSDHDLAYFDLLGDKFHDVIAKGGHVIIGSHPDLNQGLLEQLLSREDLSHVWFATVGRVVERCRAVLSPGAVTAVTTDDGAIALRSELDIHDVEIEIWQPRATEAMVATLHLSAGEPWVVSEGNQVLRAHL